MLVSFVLRVDAARAADGVLAGQVEDVTSGETAVIRGPWDLLAFVAAHGPSALNPTPKDGHA